MKTKNIYILFITLFIILYVLFKRQIEINLIFTLYDIYSFNGLYWKTTPEYCSPMKNGFTPVMPLEFYADFNKAVFERIPSGNNKINETEIIKICDRNLDWLRKNGKKWEKATQIEIIDFHTENSKEKIVNLLKKDKPFVIRGIKLKCFETMKFDKLIEKNGKDKVYMSPSSEESCPDNIFTELRNIMKNKCYIANSTNLFYRYDDLLPDSDMDIIKNAIDGIMNNDSKQLFVGVVRGSGTPLHAAYTNNFFIMIEGEKKWSFFNPNQLALLYPSFQKKGIYIASECRFLNMDLDKEIMREKFPLLEYVERYEVELKEGDILYNPKSWFHSVYNKTNVSVACSTRWSNIYDSIPDIHMMRYGHMINPALREYVKEIYVKNGILGISQIDEHKHMIGEKDPDAIPYWDKNTTDSFKLCKNMNCSEHWHSKSS
jgi:hypothetical protein